MGCSYTFSLLCVMRVFLLHDTVGAFAYRSSEIGVLSKNPPRLITKPSKSVPRVSGAAVATGILYHSSLIAQ